MTSKHKPLTKYEPFYLEQNEVPEMPHNIDLTFLGTFDATFRVAAVCLGRKNTNIINQFEGKWPDGDKPDVMGPAVSYKCSIFDHCGLMHFLLIEFFPKAVLVI